MSALLRELDAVSQGLRAEPPPLACERIEFHNLDEDRVGIAIRLWNPTEHRSEPTSAVLESAPLGVFLPWQPLSVLAVPALEPGESVELGAEAIRPRPTPLGDFAQVPPRKLIAALLLGGRPPGRGLRGLRLLQGLMSRGPDQPGTRDRTTGSATLPADPFELLARRNPHWAGNLNVFVGRQKVERHLAQALRIHPGRVNLAMFVVGTEPDAHAFELSGDGADWEAALYDGTFRQSLVIDRDAESPVRQSEWIQTSGHHLMILAICPPEDCARGTVKVHVTQRSSGKTAVVEFSLDPRAQGPGCYVV